MFDEKLKAELKDEILHHLIDFGKGIDVNNIHTEFFEDRYHVDKIKLLAKEIADYGSDIVKVVSNGRILAATGITTDFLEKGGFIGLHHKQELEKKKEEKLKGQEQKKLSNEVRLTGWQIKSYPFVLIVSVLTFIYTLVDFIEKFKPKSEPVAKEYFQEELDKIKTELQEENRKLKEELFKAEMLISTYESEKTD